MIRVRAPRMTIQDIAAGNRHTLGAVGYQKSRHLTRIVVGRNVEYVA
jgi:hypothetical protein